MLKFGSSGMNSFERCKYSSAFIMHSPHIHDYHELYFLEDGQTTYFLDNSIYILNSGDFILIPEGHLHQTDNSRSPLLERVLLNFDDKFIGQEYSSFLEELKKDPHVRLSESDIPMFKKLVKQIEHETLSEQENSVILQKLYLRQLLVLLCRHRKKDTVSDFGSAYRIAQQTARYISTNYKQPLNLSILSKKYSVSPGYLSKLFKKYTGMGINQYINISRVMAAKELLESTDMSVTAVAYECGFNDSNYFSQIFKQMVGTTPKKYSMHH